VYGESRADHVSRIYNMFSAIPFTVLAPSVSALEIWKQRAGLPNKGTMVLPHCRLETDSNGLLQAAHEGPIRIAFLSYPTVHKGWPVFEELVDRLADNPHFEFHYLGKNAPDGPRSSRLKFTRVEVTPDNRQAMSQAIHSARINFAILWSIAPETFGFTSLEAVAGGATVLTFRGAGNIARLVTENGIGRVFDSEAELFSFFESGEAAREAAKGRLAGRRITYNGMTAEAVDRGV
jgi:hypothetical protein